jgi:hypothetical protein
VVGAVTLPELEQAASLLLQLFSLFSPLPPLPLSGFTPKNTALIKAVP